MDIDHDEGDESLEMTIILAAIAVVIAVERYKKLFLVKGPYYNLTLHGTAETQLIIGATEKACRDMLRLRKRAFFSLIRLMWERGLLCDSKTVQVEEQVVIFLHTIAHNVKNRVMALRYGHSGETISRYFNIVLHAILKLYPVLLKPPSTTTPQRISKDRRRFYPYFKDCIGAIDGLHIPAWVTVDKHRRFRDRKGDISQNILAACNFDMKFTYILSGWEGSASDARILDHAIHKEGAGKLVVPQGKFYLVDAGFANQSGFLRPYRNVRYHLKEWNNSNLRPADKKELFNLRHSSLRNVIERSFSHLKSRFKILKTQAEYPFDTQANIVIACAILHNHILTQNSVEEEEAFLAQEDATVGPSSSAQPNQRCEADVEDDSDIDDESMDNVDCNQFREQLADNMWDDYVARVDDLVDDSVDDDDDDDMFDNPVNDADMFVDPVSDEE
ncbi:putative nuclease HARBI1 [Telopea speciosissima]|uniref:putative nuclease HARBI1 n=1 Tax=Telopea speciosissima TaxID=54955 RepID=UPI001CC63ADA|nr:putative nuclease HARBI1 [Telopea speciosissima]